MYAKNVTPSDLEAIGRDLGFSVNADWRGTRAMFTLRLGTDRNRYASLKPNPTDIDWSAGPRAISWKWRRTGGSVCYHGHFVYLRELFRRYPDAVVTSGLFGKVTYTADTFEQEAERLGNRTMGNPGNIYSGFQFRDMCNCESVKRPYNVQHEYGSVNLAGAGVTINATHEQLVNWAYRPDAKWPCSELARIGGITAAFDPDGLADLSDGTDNLSGNELSAWSSDVLRDVLTPWHPAYPVTVDQFEDSHKNNPALAALHRAVARGVTEHGAIVEQRD